MYCQDMKFFIWDHYKLVFYNGGFFYCVLYTEVPLYMYCLSGIGNKVSVLIKDCLNVCLSECKQAISYH